MNVLVLFYAPKNDEDSGEEKLPSWFEEEYLKDQHCAFDIFYKVVPRSKPRTRTSPF